MQAQRGQAGTSSVLCRRLRQRALEAPLKEFFIAISELPPINFSKLINSLVHINNHPNLWGRNYIFSYIDPQDLYNVELESDGSSSKGHHLGLPESR